VGTSPPHLGNDARKLLHLHFHTAHGSQPLLSEFSCPLVLRVPDQLHNPALIWRKPSDLPDNRANKTGLVGLDSLALRGLDDLRDGGRRVPLVEASR